jgi:hypothetical protein
MPSVPARTLLAAAAAGMALTCLAASAAAAKTTTHYGDEFHSKTTGCTAARDMHRRDVVVRCGKGKVARSRLDVPHARRRREPERLREGLHLRRLVQAGRRLAAPDGDHGGRTGRSCS